MLDIGWPELLLLGVIALLLFGPKELARLMRSLGRMTAMARESLWRIRGALEEVDSAPNLIGSETRPDSDPDTTKSSPSPQPSKNERQSRR